MRERTGILANTRKTSQEMMTGLENSQSPINTTTRNLAQDGQVPRNGIIGMWPQSAWTKFIAQFEFGSAKPRPRLCPHLSGQVDYALRYRVEISRFSLVRHADRSVAVFVGSINESRTE